MVARKIQEEKKMRDVPYAAQGHMQARTAPGLTAMTLIFLCLRYCTPIPASQPVPDGIYVQEQACAGSQRLDKSCVSVLCW